MCVWLGKKLQAVIGGGRDSLLIQNIYAVVLGANMYEIQIYRDN